MKNLRNFAIFILAAAVLSSCGGLNKMVKNADQVGYTVTPEVLEMHGGDVDVAVDVNYPAKYFSKKAVVTLTPVLRYEGGEKDLNPLVLQGEDVTANNRPISYDNGGRASVSNTFEYENEMLRSELYFSIEAAIKNKTADLGDVKLADGIIATPQLVSTSPAVLFFDDNYQQIVPSSFEADIKYVINRADVRRSEMDKDEISELNDVIAAADADERTNLKGLEISAYASPDGEVDFNTKLAEQRKNSADRYLEGQLRSAEVEVADELMSLLSTPEDWDGFKAAMEASSIQDKEMILRVLSMHSDPVVREQEIRNLSAAFEVIKEEILPQLRRSKFTVNTEHIGWSDQELQDLWTSNSDTLVLEELLHTATLFDELETKLAIYEKAIAGSPGCLRAHNNAGAVLFQMGEVERAKASFEAAKALRDLDIINNNLGAVALVTGDVAGAKEAFTASLAAGPKVNYNLGIVNIIEGDYESAVNYFGSEASYNAALAQYLQGNSDAAWRTLANVDMQTLGGMGYYLRAVIAASQDNTDLALENLGLGVQNCGDPDWMKARAVKDLEFAKLFNEAGFRAIVE